MFSARTRHASSLRLLLQGVVSSVIAASTMACGGQIAGPADDAGIDADVSVPIPVPDCYVSGISDSTWSMCRTWEVTLAGDLATCGSDAAFTREQCLAICYPKGTLGFVSSCSRVTPDKVICEGDCAVDGRRPPIPLSPPARPNAHDLGPNYAARGAKFAEMAYFEAASVVAFDVLYTELSAYDAPKSLLTSIRRARFDEVRHTAMATEMATRYGVTPVDSTFEAPPPCRTLLEIALENVAEGCGREALGAAHALLQSQTAEDPAHRAFYTIIARDESRHAALGFRLHTWLWSQLDEAGRDQVARKFAEVMAQSAGDPLAAQLRLELAA